MFEQQFQQNKYIDKKKLRSERELGLADIKNSKLIYTRGELDGTRNIERRIAAPGSRKVEARPCGMS